MGSGIAALASSAGIPVVLLDIPGEGDDRGAPAREGLKRAIAAKPAAFMHPDRAALVATGNTEDDLGMLAACDWIIEAIIEQPEPKQKLFARLEDIMKASAIVSSNTSGIPMETLLEGRSENFRKHFIGAHFFNPPRYMHLLELIPTEHTADEVVQRARDWSEIILGKGTVMTKDVPGFIANRLGLFGVVETLRLMQEFDLTIDEVDALTGPLIGRPKSATFRTGDLTGIDVLQHVARGMSKSTGEDFALPAWVERLVENRQLGDKTGGGFYRKQGKDIQTLDPKTGEYRPKESSPVPSIETIARLPLTQRLAAIREFPGKHGDFLRRLLISTARYTLETAPRLAYDIPSVDRALEWGYAWDIGPFRVMDYLGLDWLREQMSKDGGRIPELLAKAGSSFYDDSAGTVASFGGAREEIPAIPGSMPLVSLHRTGRTVHANDEAAVLDLGDGVLCLQFRGKMNTIGPGALDMLARALETAEREGRAGVVIGNDDPRAFSAGANLAAMAPQLQSGDWKAIEGGVRAFQGASMSIRYAPVPVIVAPFGLTLGGGCEFMLHADLVQAHAELYTGLVEVGVGLLPGGGGTKELLFRYTSELDQYEETDLFEGVKRAFKYISTATTSTSALDAKVMGYLRGSDRISMNRDRLIGDAKQRVLDLAPDYVPPVPRTIRALGREALGNLEYGLFAFREAGYASEHDVRIGHEIAVVLSGGDGPPRVVSEQDILDLERESFLKLLGMKETQQRIEHMLKTGKPLRN
jgi:3-hydroxyacyl-CoA dehydrogenase